MKSTQKNTLSVLSILMNAVLATKQMLLLKTAFHFHVGFLALPNPSSHLHSSQTNNRSAQRGCTLR